MSKRVLGAIVTDKNVSLVFDGKPYTIPSESVNYPELAEKLRTGDYFDEEISELITIRKLISRSFKQIVDTDLALDEDTNEIFYKNVRLPEVMEKKLLQDLKNNYNVDAFARFTHNLMQNPSQVAINELYLFMEAANMPITEDGHFLAYKRIRDNYTDTHSGTMDNSIGKIVSIERGICDTDRNNTCSVGLHFCSFDYLSSFSGQRVIILKINPKDVVAIPADYNNTKGRACRYEVIGELDKWHSPYLEDKEAKEILPEITPKPVYAEEDYEESEHEDEYDAYDDGLYPEEDEPVAAPPKVAAKPKAAKKPAKAKAAPPKKDTKKEEKPKRIRIAEPTSAKFAWMAKGVKSVWGMLKVEILTEPYRKGKDAWKVDVKVGKKTCVVLCRELTQA